MRRVHRRDYRCALFLLARTLSCGLLMVQAVAASQLDACIDHLHFFEQRTRAAPASGQRAYTTQFYAVIALYTGMELALIYPSPGRVIEVPLACRYVQPSGTVQVLEPVTLWAQLDSINHTLIASLGWDAPGSWAPGAYWVEYRLEGQVIARSVFEVSTSPPSRVESTIQRQSPAASIAPPSAQLKAPDRRRIGSLIAHAVCIRYQLLGGAGQGSPPSCPLGASLQCSYDRYPPARGPAYSQAKLRRPSLDV